VSLADFDRFIEEQGDVDPSDVPTLFADWLAQQTGEVVIGAPADEPPLVVAIPDEPDGLGGSVDELP
jgi:hypothetical protein